MVLIAFLCLVSSRVAGVHAADDRPRGGAGRHQDARGDQVMGGLQDVDRGLVHADWVGAVDRNVPGEPNHGSSGASEASQ